MSPFKDVPVEIMSLVFEQAWELYQFDDTQIKVKKEPRRLFPFNAAAVCVFWLNVLKSRPQYWKCVTFDVADDPTPFLNTLGLYAGGDIDVRVVSSRKSSVTQLQEKARLQTIYSRLEQYLSICSTIEFDLVFQSSLPSSAEILTHHIPCLSSLSLRCQIHNCDDNILDIKIDTDKISRKKNSQSALFPALKRLSLTGYSFMELPQLGRNWARIPDTARRVAHSPLHLSVNHFKFHKRGHCDNNGSRSFKAFLKTIDLGTRYKKFELVFTDISIDYRPNTGFGGRSIPFTSIKFKDTSRDFISAFFGSFSPPSRQHCLDTIHFQGCSIPYIPNCAWTQTDMLIIGHTPFRKTLSFSSSLTERLDDSLYNAVSAFQPKYLRLRSCEELNDAFFDWYCEEVGDITEWGLTSLDIAHCNEFSARALCNFVRYRLDLDDEDIPIISELWVKGGRNTLLAKADAQWFRTVEKYIDIDWIVSYEGEVGEEYLTTFHTYNE